MGGGALITGPKFLSQDEIFTAENYLSLRRPGGINMDMWRCEVHPKGDLQDVISPPSKRLLIVEFAALPYAQRSLTQMQKTNL